jgi:hypothetical protein
MTITTLSSREFNQDSNRAKKAAKDGPVFITDRGQPSHVLLSIDAYRKLTASPVSIVDLIDMTDAADIDFDPPKAVIGLKPADFE